MTGGSQLFFLSHSLSFCVLFVTINFYKPTISQLHKSVRRRMDIGNSAACCGLTSGGTVKLMYCTVSTSEGCCSDSLLTTWGGQRPPRSLVFISTLINLSPSSPLLVFLYPEDGIFTFAEFRVHKDLPGHCAAPWLTPDWFPRTEGHSGKEQAHV